MIVARIDGGLGNQMFQYAFGFYLAQTHRTQLELDLSPYTAGPQHGYLLDRWQVTAAPIGRETCARIPRRYRSGASSWVPD